MRTRNATSPGRRGQSPSVSYPSPFARRPIYMYGMLRGGPAAVQQNGEAMLGLGEDADAAAAAAVHFHHRADPRQSDGHRFMFGVAPEQCLPAVPAEATYYFWHIEAV